MTLKLSITTEEHGELNETLQAEYIKQTDGDNYTLDTIKAGGLSVENVDGLKVTVTKLRNELATAQTSIATFKGIEDPEKAILALSKYDEIENWDGDARVKETVAAQIATVTKKHSESIDKIQVQLTLAETQLKNSLVISSATQAIQEADGNVRLMMPHVMNRVNMEKTSDGKYIAQVLDEAGQPAIGDGQGNPMTIPQLVGEMKQDEAFAAGFDGTGSTGSGASKVNADGTSKKTSGSKRVIQSTDQTAMNNSLEDIASGKVTVEMAD